MQRGFSAVLDFSRWIAAFAVLVGHVRHIVLVDYRDVAYPGVFTRLLYFFTGFGHEAVVIFFVLSGFLVGGITANKWRRTGIDLTDYFIHRFTRIYIVLLPAMMLTMTLDLIGFTCFNGAELYTNSAKFHTNILDLVLHHDFSLKTFMGNVAMLENIAVPIQGSLLTVWSLVDEWWYYCLFAAAASLLLCESKPQRTLSALALIVMAFSLPGDLLLWGLIWLLGMLTFIYCKSAKPKPSVWLSAFVFLAAMIYSRFTTHNMAVKTMSDDFAKDLLVAVVYSLLLVSLYGKQFSLPFASLHQKLAAFSYSLYLAHFPTMIFAVAFLNSVFGLSFQSQPDARSLLYFAALIAFLILFAFLFSLFTERHTEWMRKWLLSWFAKQSGAVAS